MKFILEKAGYHFAISHSYFSSSNILIYVTSNEMTSNPRINSGMYVKLKYPRQKTKYLTHKPVKMSERKNMFKYLFYTQVLPEYMSAIKENIKL